MPRALLPPQASQAGGRSTWAVRGTSILLAALLMTACTKQEIVYLDREHGEDSHGSGSGSGATILASSLDPRVHRDGHHEVEEEHVEIGPGADHAPPYVPIENAGGPLLNSSASKPIPPFQMAHERGSAGATGPVASASPRAAAKPAAAGAKPGVGEHAMAVSEKPVVAVASPTTPARYNIGAGFAPKPAEGPNTTALDESDDDEMTIVAGRVESIAGQILTVSTPVGTKRVKMSQGAKVERDAMGTAADLRSGQFVGMLHQPGGPATSVRLYTTGPSMPRPGVVPMAGSRVGQVTTFGQIVNLQFGGVLLNTGGETATVTLPNNVEILKPAPASASDVAVGSQIIATGVTMPDEVLGAMSIRVTRAAPPASVDPTVSVRP